MSLRTWLLFLVGNRQATLVLAADRRALWIGMLFVLSAGFAREYDRANLLSEPWHLLVPLAASLAASFLLFTFLFLPVIREDAQRPPFFRGYRSFLTLFWMTAPLAWLYAIPYERLLTSEQAVAANFLTLGLVAAWRVALMMRVAHVLMGYRPFAAFALVLAFADAVLLVAEALSAGTLFQFMSGIHATPAQRLASEISFIAMTLAQLAAPVLLIETIWIYGKVKPAWQLPGVTNGSTFSVSK